MRRWWWLVVPLVLLAGCGGPSDEDQIQDVVKQFGTALEEGDGVAACDLASKRLEEGLAGGQGDCEDGIAVLTGGLGLDFLGDSNISGTVGDVEVDGDKATARIGTASVKLVKEGDWKVDQFSPGG